METKLVEVSDEMAENLVENRNDVVEFIWQNIGEYEQQNTQGKNWIEGYVETCGCGIFMAEVSVWDCPKCGSKRNKSIAHGTYKCENCECKSFVEMEPDIRLVPF